jgi:hypothetical protein
MKIPCSFPDNDLIDWALEEMVGRSNAGLGHIFAILKKLPLASGPHSTTR